MSFVFTQPQFLLDAATDLAGIGSVLNAANTAAAVPTTNVLAAGADDISAVMAAMFGAHAQQYQAMGAQAANLHAQFVQAMKAASSAYIDAEAANASPLNLVEQATQRVAAFSTAGPHNRLVPTTSRSAYRAFGAGGPGGVGKLGAA